MWETGQNQLFCDHSAVYAETWPVSGMTRNGVAYALPMPALPISGTGSSSSHGLLPTPAAGNFNDGEDLESWEARRQRNLAKGINGNGQGTPLAIAVQQLLPTPNSTDYKGGGQPPGRMRNGHPRPASDADLPQAVLDLLPTPTARKNGGANGRHGDTSRGDDLPETVQHLPLEGGGDLLPTPSARDWKSGQSNIMDRNARPLNEVVVNSLGLTLD